MKQKSIIYQSFVPKTTIMQTSLNTSDSQSSSTSADQPSFKYTGYQPQYKGDDSETVDVPINNPSQELEESTEDPFLEALRRTQIEPEVSTRGTTIYKSQNIDVGNMRDLLNRFNDAGISVRVTSGRRPGAVTSNGSRSGHSEGGAIDITPGEGETGDSMISKLKASPDLVKYMRDNGLGILDERSEDMQARTGATGAHGHIGKDQSAIKGLDQILSAKKGSKLPKRRIRKAEDGTELTTNIQTDTLGVKTPLITKQYQERPIPSNITVTPISVSGVGNFTKLSTTRNGQTLDLGYRGTAHNDGHDNGNQTRLNTGRFTDQITQEDIDRQVANRNSTAVIIGTNFNVQGNQVSTGEYNPYQHKINVGSQAIQPGSSVLLHEGAHASHAIPQEEKVKEILSSSDQSKGNIGGEKDQGYGTEYGDSEKEAYARLMQARKDMNLDPEHIYTEQEVKDLQQRANRTSAANNFGNRYDSNTLTRLINDVASMQNNIDMSLLGKSGLKVPTDKAHMQSRTGLDLYPVLLQNLDKNFVRRMFDPNPTTIRNGENRDERSNLKMISGDGGIGPEIQEIDNRLIDFTNPKNKKYRSSVESAYKNNDYIELRNDYEARGLGKGYKKFFGDKYK